LGIGLDRFVSVCGLPSRHNNDVYGNALEALVGAIYVDKGYKQCRRFLLDRVFSRYDDMEAVVKADKNYKSRVIEWAQKNHKDIEFRILKEELQKDGVYFVSELLVNGEVFGIGDGFSKRESHQKAAREALSRLGI
jgi:ribonuclease-3